MKRIFFQEIKQAFSFLFYLSFYIHLISKNNNIICLPMKRIPIVLCVWKSWTLPIEILGLVLAAIRLLQIYINLQHNLFFYLVDLSFLLAPYQNQSEWPLSCLQKTIQRANCRIYSSKRRRSETTKKRKEGKGTSNPRNARSK